MKNFIFFFSVVISSFSFAQTIPLDTAVHTGTLSNGFTYYIRHNEEPKNRVQLYLVNKVGSVLEDDDQQGLAHFMEHMNFNGTTHFPKNELVNYLQKSGVRFGADLNAYTSFDETVYQLPIPSDDPAVLKNGFMIMRDWARNATLDPVEIDKERGVVLEEERLGRGAQERMQRLYFPVMLNQSRYAERLPIGKVVILENFKPEVIRRFYSDWYRPDLQALVVVGDIDATQTEALVKSLFSDLANPPNERPRTKFTAPLTGKNQFLTVTDREMPETVIQIMVKHKDEKLITEENYLHSMQRQLFNQMLSQRYAEFAQTPALPYIGAEAGIGGLLGGLDNFSLEISLKQGQFAAGFQAAWRIIERIRRFGFTETELARAKLNYIGGMEAALKEMNKTNSASFVGEYQRLFLSQEASPGIKWEYSFVKDHIDQITLSDVNALVKDYIQDQNRDILVLAPEKDNAALPDSTTVAGWITAIAGESLTAYTDEGSQLALMTANPVKGKVVKTNKIDGLGITELTLSNGIKVILKPTVFKNNEIRFTAFSPGGASLYSDAEYQNALNSGLLADFGVADYNPSQLNKILSGKIINVRPYISDRSVGINGYSVPKDLESTLQLVYLQFTSPRKDTAIFNNIISNSKEMIANRYSDPKNVFSDTVTRVLGNYNYRRTPPSISKLDELDLDKITRIYRERFADASGFTFLFTGSFNIDSITPLLEKYLGSLPSLYKKELAIDRGIHITYGKLVKKVYKGTENKATVKMVYSGDFKYSAETIMQLNALKEVLQIKITQHLREDESQVYSPSVRIETSIYPRPAWSLTVGFGCAPKNVDHLIDLVEKEIKTLRENGPVPEDVEKFKAEYRRTHEVQLTNNEYWLSYMDFQTENNEDMNQVLGYYDRLDKVSPASVQKTARQFLDGGNEILFELLPEQDQ